MNTHTTSRRGALGALGVGASLLAGVPAVLAARAETTVSADPKWIQLVAAYRDTRVRWLAAVDGEEQAEIRWADALKELPAEPEKPDHGVRFETLTLAQLRDWVPSPAEQGADDKYKLAQAGWKKQREALKESITGDAKLAQKGAYSTFQAALDAMAHYRVSSLSDLHQKTVLIINEFRGCDMEMEYVQALAADMVHLGAQVRA